MEIINRANDARVFMKHICMSLQIQTNCTHIQFVEAFSKLIGDAMKYEEELRQILFDGVKETQGNVQKVPYNGTISVPKENGQIQKEIELEKQWRDGEEKHQQKVNNGVLQDETPLEREYEPPYPY